MGVSKVLDEAGREQEHCFQIGTMAADPAPPRVEPAPKPLAPAPTQAPVGQLRAQPRAGAPSLGAPLPLGKVLGQLRARLREVEREIALRKKLEKERDQIKRLIGAATQERDNLRRIRTAG